MNMKPLYLIVAALVVVALALLAGAPNLLLPESAPRMNPRDLVEVEMQARKYMALLIVGALLAFGLYLLYRRIAVLEKNADISHQAQLAERFNRAIDQLGTYKLEVQLGGIFALERIAQESLIDHFTIMEILTAYIRENAQWSENKQGQSDNLVLENGHSNGAVEQDKIPSDIQAVMTVIGRRKWVLQEMEQLHVINLRRTNLSNIDLRKSHFERANLRGCNLERINLMEASLAWAFLGGANLKAANLMKANLQGANLAGANLMGANLRGANLQGANLTKARLKGARLAGAILDGANMTEVNMQESDLSGVSLVNVNLTNARLYKVRYNYETIFPEWVNQDLKEELKMTFGQNS